MVPASAWSPQLRRALELCFGEDFDHSKVIVERWERVFSAKESFRITYGDRVLYAVHHRPQDGAGPGVVQLYVRVLGGLWAINKLSDVEPSVAFAKRTLVQCAAGFCALALVLALLTVSGIGDQQVSFSLTF